MSSLVIQEAENQPFYILSLIIFLKTVGKLNIKINLLLKMMLL
jgi:hypothetical protein